MPHQGLRIPGQNNLVIVSYVAGSRHVLKENFIESDDRSDVTLDLEKGMWYLRRGTALEESYEIGKGVRVPEEGEFEGIMMIYDPDVDAHRIAVTAQVKLHELGQLRP